MTKTKLLQIRVEQTEHDDWTIKAAASGLSLSEWVRGRCNGTIIDASHHVPVTGTPPVIHVLPVHTPGATGGPRWVCKCGQKNIDTAICGCCKELAP